jgi:tight adherence protein B
MPTSFIPLPLLKLLAMSSLAFGVLLGMYTFIADPLGPAKRYWDIYTGGLERKMRLMFIFKPGAHIAYGQIAAFLLVFAAGMFGLIPYWGVVLAVVCVAPAIQLERMRLQRVVQIEEQINTFLMGLANGLKATPSLADAFAQVQFVISPPIKLEIELATKEMRVGNTLDQSLLNIAARVQSKSLDNALSAVLIGRQVGGNLPKVLETTALAIREMSRLEGVVKTKTAEGKAQLWVLGLLPLVLMFALHNMQPGYFDPLRDNIIGWIISFVAGTFWVTSIAMARKILQVDI